MTPTIVDAFLGSLKTFFSIWQLCIMQVTPFYLAFFIGSYFMLSRGGRRKNLSDMLLVGIGIVTGFSLVFSFMSVPVSTIGGLLLQNVKDLRFISGVFIIGTGLLMILFALSLHFDYRGRIMAALSPMVGAAFAIGYSPCISPALSELLNYAMSPGNSHQGLVLLFIYAVALCLSITSIGIMGVFLLKSRGGRHGNKGGSLTIPVASSVVFMLMGVLLVSGYMLRYKMFLVNLF